MVFVIFFLFPWVRFDSVSGSELTPPPSQKEMNDKQKSIIRRMNFFHDAKLNWMDCRRNWCTHLFNYEFIPIGPYGNGCSVALHQCSQLFLAELLMSLQPPSRAGTYILTVLSLKPVFFFKTRTELFLSNYYFFSWIEPFETFVRRALLLGKTMKRLPLVRPIPDSTCTIFPFAKSYFPTPRFWIPLMWKWLPFTMFNHIRMQYL